MSKQRSVLVVLIILWAGFVVASYFMSVRIEGPRNIDTGFQRLDVLFRYQMMAFAVAVLSVVLGVLWRRSGKRMLLMGAIPLLTTVLAAAGLFGVVALYDSGPPPENIGAPVTEAPAAPADRIGD